MLIEREGDEIEVIVEGIHIPGEPQSWEDPGCSDAVEIQSIKTKHGADIELTDEELERAEKKLWDELIADAANNQPDPEPPDMELAE